MATQAPIESLLAPISGEHPAGEDITLAPEWETINAARHKDKVLGRQKADWPRIQKLLCDALTHKSKDLRLAVWLTEANVKQHGFAGLRDSLHLLRALIVDYWDSGLYPSEDFQLRAKPLDYFAADNLPADLRQIPLTARTDGGRDYSYLEYERSRRIGWERDIVDETDQTKEAKIKRVLAGGGIFIEMFEEAAKSSRR